MNSTGRLFSEDGIDASHARTIPRCVYLPDESTLNEIKYLFTTLKSTQSANEDINGPLHISNLPFSTDLAMLTSDVSETRLTLEDVINGMCRIATHFVSNHQLIQARANAYVRCKLAGAEVHINGVISSQNEQSVEQDQILLTSATVPSSPRDFNNIYNDVINDDANGQLSRASSRRDIGSAADSAKDCATPPPPTLFRSSSVRQEHFNTFPPNLFTMDDRTLRAAMSFMPELFQHNGFVSRKKLPAYDAGRLTELWEFFDFDDDGIVTRDDVMLGLGNIARNFLATDDFTQMLTNSYVQRKIRKAIFAIDKHQRATGSHSATQYSSYESKSESLHRLPIKVKHEPGNTVIYTDEEGNQHVTKIIRMSQRSVAGGDAYYIETKGVKLCVAASRLRPMDEQDSVMLQRIDQNPQGFRQKPHKDTLASNANSTSLSSAAASTVGKGSSSRNGGGLHTPAKQSTAGFSTSSLSAETMGTAPSEDAALPTSASKGGILGYLKSSIGILGIGNGKPTVSAATVIPETQTSYNRSKRKGSGDNESNMKIQEDVESVVEVVGVEGQVEEEGGNEGVCCNMKERDAEGEDEEGVPVPVPMSESNSHSHLTSGLGSSKGSIEEQGQGEAVPTAVSAELVDAAAVVGDAEPTVAAVTTSDNNSNSSSSALSVTTSQRLRQSTAMLALDGEILQAVRKVTGPSYKLTRSMFPRPKKTEPYPIYFNRGKNGFFEFNQVDFGVQFIPFMKEMVIPALDPRWQTHSETLSETNRCFFLHFGVAMGLHPLSLQQCFRNAAAELLKFPENEMTIFFGEALESLLLRNDFVDAQVLSAIWPLEFDRYKVLIVRVDHNGRIESFTSFRSEAGPVDDQGEWNGEELIFTLQWNHFTILKPKSDLLNRPITAVLAAASMIGIVPLEFITKVDPDPTKRFKIC